MNISIFDVIGPVMIGPSSSHTAGAARLARIGRLIAGKPFSHVAFGLHGSFAKTYKGHGTDRALVAGALGLMEDDERLSEAFQIAEQQQVSYEFYEVELDGMHENSVQMRFFMEDGTVNEVIGSSVGGAGIMIRQINGFEMDFTAQAATLIIRQRDRRGVVSEISKVLADHDINIGIMKLSRKAKGDVACCVIEIDDTITENTIEQLRRISEVLSVQAILAETEKGER